MGNSEEYIKQLEETIETLHKKLEEASYFKPIWCEVVIQGQGLGKHWVLQLQGNPVTNFYEKKILRYKRGTPKQRSRWAKATVANEIICRIDFNSDSRCIPYIFGKEHEWQPNLEECKKYVNRIIFGVDEI